MNVKGSISYVARLLEELHSPRNPLKILTTAFQGDYIFLASILFVWLLCQILHFFGFFLSLVPIHLSAVFLTVATLSFHYLTVVFPAKSLLFGVICRPLYFAGMITVIYFTGGIYSPFILLLLLYSITDMLLLHVLYGMYSFILGAIFLGGMILFQEMGWLIQFPVYAGTLLDFNEQLFFLYLVFGILSAGGIYITFHVSRLIRLQSERLAESEERYRELVETSIDGIFRIGSDGSFTFINSPFEKLLGYEAGEWVGRPFQDILTPASREVAREHFLKAMTSQEPYSRYEVELIRKDGGLVPVELSISTHYLDGKPVARHGIARDITQRKMLESQTNELNKMKDNLSQMLVHDFKTPITVIKGYLELLAKKEENETHKKWIFQMQIYLSSLQQMVYNLLDISRLESATTSILVKENLTLGKLIEDVVGEMKFVADDKEVAIESQVYQPDTEVLADKAILGRILTNLLNNAIKFTPSGKNIIIKAEVGKDEQLLNAPSVKISVIDHGEGISGENLEKVFQKYWTTTPEGKGTGLGLTFCKLAVEAHGGKIRVDSEFGKGSTFSFVIPLGI